MIKRKIKTTPPPFQWWKNGAFCFARKFWGKGGLISYFILSKIVAFSFKILNENVNGPGVLYTQPFVDTTSVNFLSFLHF